MDSVHPLARCASEKEKIRRDEQRLADFETMSDALETVRVRDGHYPDLLTGTYLRTLVNSRWPSWQTTFASALGTSNLPEDPINRFLTCGRCQASATSSSSVSPPLGLTCSDNSECPADQNCVALAEDGTASSTSFDPATCWSLARRLFMCPVSGVLHTTPTDPSPAFSQIYQYQAQQGGVRYDLSAALEGPTTYVPPLLSEIRRCSNTHQFCTANTTAATDAECRVFAANGTTVISNGKCNGVGGHWFYRWNDPASSGICGGGAPVSENDVCAVGVRGATQACSLGETSTVNCTLPGGGTGLQTLTCASNCHSFVPISGTAGACRPMSTCGNGIVEKYRCVTVLGGGAHGIKEGQLCNTVTSGIDPSTECTDPRDPVAPRGMSSAPVLMGCAPIPHPEVCDDGPLNGTYGHCNITCTGIDRYCGNGMLDPGETCDNGSTGPTANADYYSGPSSGLSVACDLTCHGIPGYCGDGIVQPDHEQCDGNTQQTASAICSAGDATKVNEPCTTNADCGTGGVCGSTSDPHFASCTGVTVSRCAGGPHANASCSPSPVQVCSGDHTVTCTGSSDCPSGIGPCITDTNTGCEVPGALTSGVCTSYSTVHTRGCAPPDSTTVQACQWLSWSVCDTSATCGNGVLDPGEECDNGPANGHSSCTTQCKLNVCGSGEPWPGVKECDYGARPTTGALSGRMYNGDACLHAEYGATCAACSPTCHLTAGSGGYCGDGIKNGAEQCDGTDGVTSDLTCRGLGYDYADQVRCAHPAFYTDTSGHNPITISGSPGTTDCTGGTVCLWSTATFLGHSVCISSPRPESCIYNDASDGTPSSIPLSSDTADVVCSHGATRNENISCGSSCTFSGCSRCQDTPGTGAIRAQVLDPVYNLPVSGARVTLYYRGMRVTETYTDTAGLFSFNTLNEKSACGLYRVIVDFYGDLTSSIHTSVNGGYWPFESGTFQALNFSAQIPSAPLGGVAGAASTPTIYLVPRVARGETLAVHTYDPGAGYTFADHLILPTSRGYSVSQASFNIVLRGWQNTVDLADPSAPPLDHGLRDVHGSIWPDHGDVVDTTSLGGSVVFQQAQGKFDAFPFASLACPFAPHGSCAVAIGGTTPIGPSIAHYQVNDGIESTTAGSFAYYVENETSASSPAVISDYMSSVHDQVQVITFDHVYAVANPSSSGSCDTGTSYWQVYHQAMADGSVVIDNRIQCAGDPLPSEPGERVPAETVGSLYGSCLPSSTASMTSSYYRSPMEVCVMPGYINRWTRP